MKYISFAKDGCIYYRPLEQVTFLVEEYDDGLTKPFVIEIALSWAKDDQPELFRELSVSRFIKVDDLCGMEKETIINHLTDHFMGIIDTYIDNKDWVPKNHLNFFSIVKWTERWLNYEFLDFERRRRQQEEES